jgi:hypothetical protein
MNDIKDFLGTPIHVGDRGIRVSSYGHWKEFVKVTVKEINLSRSDKTYVGIISDDNTRIGWTYPDRIIVQNSLSVKI